MSEGSARDNDAQDAYRGSQGQLKSKAAEAKHRENYHKSELTQLRAAHLNRSEAIAKPEHPKIPKKEE